MEAPTLMSDGSVWGRDKDKEVLIKELIKNLEADIDDTKHFSTISIVGMRGVEKTTSAQFVFNDQRVKRHFGKMSWVYVSNDFNVR